MSIESTIFSYIDQYFSPLIAEPNKPSANQAPGGICGVYYKGNSYYRGYGIMNDNGDLPTEHTVFGLGSVTKVLTTSILGQQTHPDFSSSIADYLPSGYQLQSDEEPATFEQLATFTAGIPSVSSKTKQSTTQEEFIHFINHIQPLNGNLPAPNVYSDSSIGFLAQILMSMNEYSNYDDTNTTQWWQENLLQSLNMNYTGAPAIVDADHPLSDAYFYDSTSETYQNQNYAGWVPWGAAGRAYSTCEDMMKFIMVNTGVNTIDGNTVPPSVLNGMQQAQYPWAPPQENNNNKQGFAWIVFNPNSSNSYVGKAGGVPGVSSFITASHNNQLGVIFLTNMQGVKTEEPAKELTKALIKL